MLKGFGTVPDRRIRELNDAPVRPDRDLVLYWMTAFRRTTYNFALERAVDWARELGKPLVVLEGLNVDFPWACDRFHDFIVSGMRDNAGRFKSTAAQYLAYVEPSPDAGCGLLESLASRACVVVGDDFPAYVLPGVQKAAARRLDVRLEVVDSNGIMPLRALETESPTAVSLRRKLQQGLDDWLRDRPRRDPLRRLPREPRTRLPVKLRKRWPMANRDDWKHFRGLDDLPINHEIQPGPIQGGSKQARRRWHHFLDDKLLAYEGQRNHPDADGSSGLSPALHFGHVSTHEIFWDLAEREEWTPERCAAKAQGRRAGWWGMSGAAEAFLDQFITWRELGFQFCAHRPDHDQYDSLPDWALRTLDEHRSDPRPHVYDQEQFAEARTHDALWNAAQNQLRREGRMHNYLRMLWGKKILHWTRSPEEALRIMIELNNRYAIDGRDPNSYSGIFWVLGRFDRAWGPERPIFGKVRYMASDNTRRKLRLQEYLQRYAPDEPADATQV